MRTAIMLLVGLGTLALSPAFATVELCRSIGPDKERLACFDREAAPRQDTRRRASEVKAPAAAAFVDPVQSLKTENDRVTSRLKGICRGC